MLKMVFVWKNEKSYLKAYQQDGCYLYKRKDTERSIDEKIGGKGLVLIFRSSFFSTVAGFLAGIFQRLPPIDNFRTVISRSTFIWKTYVDCFCIQVWLYSPVYCLRCIIENIMCLSGPLVMPVMKRKTFHEK